MLFIAYKTLDCLMLEEGVKKTYGMSASAIASTSINRSCVMRKLQEVEGLGGFGRSVDRKAFISTKKMLSRFVLQPSIIAWAPYIKVV